MLRFSVEKQSSRTAVDDERDGWASGQGAGVYKVPARSADNVDRICTNTWVTASRGPWSWSSEARPRRPSPEDADGGGPPYRRTAALQGAQGRLCQSHSSEQSTSRAPAATSQSVNVTRYSLTIGGHAA